MSETSNINLYKLAKKLNLNIKAIVYKNELKNYKLDDGNYIIDLHDSTDNSAGHWTCLYIKNNKYIYFDSFGIIYPNEIKTFCKSHFIEYNKEDLQNLNSGWCGVYCICCLYYLNNNHTLKQYLEMFK